MTQERRELDTDICVHIFTASAAMVGVCLTVIGIIRVVVVLRRRNSLADDMVAVDAMLYLGACLISYWALRTRGTLRNHRLVRVADSLFLGALILTVFASGYIAWAISGQ